MNNFFVNLLGERAKFDMAHRLCYSYDATKKSILPKGVLFPIDENEISEILKFANQNNISITPRGSGSGMSGGSINDGFILSLERMDKIKFIDNSSIIVQAGAINYDIQEFALINNLFYPPDPASEKFCSIGGNIAENAGGMRAAKYGVTSDFVISLGVVLANGDIIHCGKNIKKDVAGYNIKSLFCGSEGTLGIIFEARLKLLRKKKFKKSFIIYFDDERRAMECVNKIYNLGYTPLSMEFLDHKTILALKNFDNAINASVILIGAIDADEIELLDNEISKIKEISMQNDAINFKVSKNEYDESKIWALRKICSQAISSLNNTKLNEDISVPRENLGKFLDITKEISSKFGVDICCFGHAGDGNVHTNVMVDKNKNLKEGHLAVEEIFRSVIELGGSITGEHGVGTTKDKFMPLQFSNAELGVFSNIKNAFDPNKILNPNKMGLR